MDTNTNTYLLAAVLNGLQQKELGTLPPEAEFTPFNLSALRQTPKRPERPLTARSNPALRQGHVETKLQTKNLFHIPPSYDVR